MSEGYGGTPSAGAVPPDHWPPPVVASTAGHHQLGGHVATHRLPTPPSGALTSALAGGGLLVLGVVALALARAVDPYAPGNIADPGSGGDGLFWVLRILAGVSCITAVALLARAIRAAVAQPSTDSYYLYEGGIVRFGGEAPETLSWSELREAQPVLASEGPLTGRVTRYSLVRQRGWPFSVPVSGPPGTDPFAGHLVALLRARGVTILPASPA